MGSIINHLQVFLLAIHFPASDPYAGHLAPSSFTGRVAPASHKHSQVVLNRERLRPGFHRSRQHHFDATW